MSLEAAGLAMGRRMAEARMTDTVSGSYTDRAGEPTWDPATKTETYPSRAIYDGPGRIRFGNGQADDRDDQGQTVTVQAAILSLPIATSASIPIGTEFEITASQHDPGIVGRRCRVVGDHTQTAATARRLQVDFYS